MQRSTKFWIYTDVLASQFAKAIQGALREKVKETVLRTGRLRTGNVFCVTPSFVVRDKLEQLQEFRAAAIPHPPFATDLSEVKSFQGKTVFARTSLRGTQGEGIVEFDKEGVAPNAPLYVEYIPKQTEYRVHVFAGKVIDVQEKRKRRDFDEDARNPRIRNLNNGYVFCRGDLRYDDSVPALGVAAVRAVGYGYGAVDIIYSKKRNQHYVLEVNSKPGLEGSTLDIYANAIIDHFKLNRR